MLQCHRCLTKIAETSTSHLCELCRYNFQWWTFLALFGLHKTELNLVSFVIDTPSNEKLLSNGHFTWRRLPLYYVKWIKKNSPTFSTLLKIAANYLWLASCFIRNVHQKWHAHTISSGIEFLWRCQNFSDKTIHKWCNTLEKL